MFQARIAASPLAVTAIAGFPPEIDALAAQAMPSHGFLRAAWYRGAGRQPGTTLVVQRGEGGDVIAAIPLLPFGPAPARTKKVAGLYWPFRSILTAPDCTALELAAALSDKGARALGPVWRLGPALIDNRVTRTLIEAAHLAGWRVLSRPAGTGWVINLTQASAQGQPIGQPRKSMRRNLRAGWSKLEALGTPQWRMVRGDQWDDSVLDHLARIEGDSWIARRTDGSGAKFLTTDQRAVWQTALTDPVLARMLCATILMLDDRPVAFSFDLDAGPIRYAIAGSYAEDLKDCYIGKAINFRSMEHAVRAGLQMMDMGVGDSGFKREMGAQPGYELADLLFARNSLAARVLTKVWGPALPRDVCAHG